MAPFKDNVWSPPNDGDLDRFRRSLYEKDAVASELTPKMVQALTQNIEMQVVPVPSTSIFNAVDNLKGPADIVIPVYGGLHVVKPCIDSVAARTNWPYRMIIVDDFSPDPATKAYLRGLESEGATVLFNNSNRGFAASVNRGVRAGTNPYVVVLNSDVIVTDGWLTRMLIALESDQKNVICNPITNNTALINVNMYPGRSYLDMAHAVDRSPNYRFPEIMPTGFCFMLRRALWDAIGPLDEAYVSYGEETDFWFKAIRCVDETGVILGHKAVMADNCYMFHERGTSFQQIGDMAHQKQRAIGAARFKSLFPEYGEWSKGYNVAEALGPLRDGLQSPLFQRDSKGKFAFVVKSAGGSGGMLVIADIVNQMIEEGYDAKVVIVPDAPHGPGNPAMVLGSLHTAPILFSTKDDFIMGFSERVFKEGTVISAVADFGEVIKTLHGRLPNLKVLNLVQSWDPGIAEFGERLDLAESFRKAYVQYPNIVCSSWVAEEVRKAGGDVLTVIKPGVNPLMFHNRDRERHDERFTVGVMINQMYKFKGGQRGIDFARALLAASKGMDIKVAAIGVDALISIPGIVCIGAQAPAKMADLMGNELDVFVDPAHIHSYGLPALEALMSGCAAITFNDNKGASEYSKHWPDRRLQVAETIEEAVAYVLGLYKKRIAREIDPIQTERFSRAEFVQEIIKALAPAAEVEKPTYRIEVNSPHFRKHGGPSSNIALANVLHNFGHNVTMSMIYTDWNPEVLNMSKVPMRIKWDKVPSDAKVCIVNSDNPFASKMMAQNTHCKFIMYKLSHNTRFKAEENGNLNLEWDHIITSTEWLRQACLVPQEGWDHKVWDDDKVTNVGWYHYGHELFNCNPKNRTYGDSRSGFRIGTLVHHHPLKGSQDATNIIGGLRKKYDKFMQAVGVGEIPKAKLPENWTYIPFPNRPDLAHIMKQFDIWLGCSYTEGLGRMALEAMSAGAVVVTTNTGAEYLKDGENCRLYKPGDAQAAAEMIDEIVQNRNLIEKYAWTGYETACRAADKTRFSAMVNKVVEEVINK